MGPFALNIPGIFCGGGGGLLSCEGFLLLIVRMFMYITYNILQYSIKSFIRV